MWVRLEAVVDLPRRLVLWSAAGIDASVGTWHGPLPEPGLHDVELELPEVFGWGGSIGPATEGSLSPRTARSGTRLVGTLVDIDELDVAQIHLLAGDVLVGTSGEPPLGVVGEQVELHASEVHIHPTGI